MLFKLFILCYFLKGLRCAILPNEPESEIVFLNVMFRHGARTPYEFYPTDPYKNETFFPFGLGALTNEGKKGEYLLGKYIKKYYGKFLGDMYLVDDFYVRSANSPRTRMSAQLVMAGLFPPVNVQIWNPDLKWQPALVDYKSDADEDLFNPYKSCPYYMKLVKEQANNRELLKKFVGPFADTYKYVEKHSGMKLKVPRDMSSIYSTLKCESELGLKLPEWTKKVFPDKMAEAVDVVYKYDNFNPEAKKFNSGYILKKIIEDFDRKIKNDITPKERKASFYSGHETTLGYMLNSLGLEVNFVPPYGSALSIELRKSKGEFFVQLRFRKGSACKPINLVIPGCELLCPIEKFKELTKNVIPTVDMKTACKINDE
ncbi:venom acid phosphatase Acph-1-like [Aethina tumida]|uniref:venom acid phosphatase Acph-1-like n=1 Tax=Aethina tumida TaxID=116153 RepID=UPI0021478853|nr:venom acid phosphatase Acph-1-like [Aethina tumida]